jgi:hypothetical protein
MEQDKVCDLPSFRMTFGETGTYWIAKKEVTNFLS